MEYNFKDLLIQDMVDRDHVPHEQRMAGKETVVICDQCGELWPCTAREGLRQYQKDHLKRMR